MKKDMKKIFPLNIQFFAEHENPNNDPAAEEPKQGTGGNDPDEPETPSVEGLIVQNKQSAADLAKTKNALDKALKQVGDLTKQVRSMQTAEEQEADAKKEAQEKHMEYVKGLEDRIALQDATARYLAIKGMDAELAKATAQAEIDGDQETVTANIEKATEAAIKNAKAEWLKSRPAPQAGNDDGECPVTREQFNKMGYSARVKFKANYPEAYKKYSE